MSAAQLQISGLVKRFGSVIATDNLSLEVERGELHAIIGPNGAGKTTLINQLSGEMAPDGGSILLDGEDITGLAPFRVSAAGLARTFQITNVFHSFSALHNVAMAVQARTSHSFRCLKNAWTDAELTKPARATLEWVGLGHRADVPVKDLSHGEQRQLEIAIALATEPRVLLLDEPMAGMGAEESWRMVDLIRECKQQLTVLLVEHDMDAVFTLADRITVLVYGRAIATGTPEEIRANEEVKRAYLGMGLMLEVAGIESFYGPSQALFGVSLEVGPGEVLALMGRNGMGKTTTIRTIMGLVRARKGRITMKGVDITRLAPYRIARLGLGLVPEGRMIFPNLTVEENILASAANYQAGSCEWTAARIFELFPRLAERRRNMGNQISGGEQQMLAIGRALAINPLLLILDEATEGLAPLVREEIWRVLGELKRAGQSILVVDKDARALMRIASRHCILEKGRVAWSGTPNELDRDLNVMHRLLGVAARVA